MNKVILIGNLTRDPELITTNSGVSLCKFTLAVARRFASEDGEIDTDFLPVIVWRSQAENCYKYIKKGSKVAVVGSIQTRSYEGSDGQKRSVIEIVSDEVEFLSKSTATESKTEVVAIDDDDLPF